MAKNFLMILNLLLYLFVIASCNVKDNENNTTIIESTPQIIVNSKCIFVETIERPILYIGIPNILKYSENLKDSVLITMEEAQVRLFPNVNHCEIIPFKTGNKTLKVYKKLSAIDSVLVLEKVFRVKKLPMPTANLSSLKEIKKQTLVSFEELRCYVVNLPIEVKCSIESFSIIAFVDNDEVEMKSKSNRLTEGQIALIKKIPIGNHIIFNNIVAKLPNGNSTNVPDFILKIK